MFGVAALFIRVPTSYSIAETTLRGRSLSRNKFTAADEFECKTPFVVTGTGQRKVTE
jgi:hypothetical protein